ncbi:hypothetical protein ACFQVD_05740 [Streptosporangium amethystogenes subsp. fukuiense]|uniref:Uncharacterized protein n=1 Tax=Streptosporangium amethystogenes subsp. fukuiense TaxID=698418 RepID=A0ABW2SUG1_9ACTN
MPDRGARMESVDRGAVSAAKGPPEGPEGRIPLTVAAGAVVGHEP